MASSVQDVGYVSVPHVCASEPGPPPAQERGFSGFFADSGGPNTDTLHREVVGRSWRCDGRAGTGDPPGAASAAESGEASGVRSIF